MISRMRQSLPETAILTNFVWVICLVFGLSPDRHAYESSEDSSRPAPLSWLVRVFVALQSQTYQYLDVLMLHFCKMLTY